MGAQIYTAVMVGSLRRVSWEVYVLTKWLAYLVCCLDGDWDWERDRAWRIMAGWVFEGYITV
jgi:hypothetical protein